MFKFNFILFLTLVPALASTKEIGNLKVDDSKESNDIGLINGDSLSNSKLDDDDFGKLTENNQVNAEAVKTVKLSKNLNEVEIPNQFVLNRDQWDEPDQVSHHNQQQKLPNQNQEHKSDHEQPVHELEPNLPNRDHDQEEMEKENQFRQHHELELDRKKEMTDHERQPEHMIEQVSQPDRQEMVKNEQREPDQPSKPEKWKYDAENQPNQPEHWHNQPDMQPALPDLLVITVATNDTEGFKRLMDSAHFYNVNIKVLGYQTKWKGGDMFYAGGGHKINLVKDYLESVFEGRDESNIENRIIMFIDAYDTLLLGDSHEILDRFDALDAGIVFSAELFCWPDRSLASHYPPVDTTSSYKYLNSGGYIGYARNIYHLLRSNDIEDADDDQLYLSRLYLDQDIRQKFKMKLDTQATIFQNLHGASGDVSLKHLEGTTDNEIVLVNTRMNSEPLVLHGNGHEGKLTLNSLANYLAGAWHPILGCSHCRDVGRQSVKTGDETETKEGVVLIGVFITVKTPFIPEFLEKIVALDYPKKNMHFFLYNGVEYHKDVLDEFAARNASEYKSFKRIKFSDNIDERRARTFAIERCLMKKCDYLMMVDGVAHLDSPLALKALISDNKPVVAPLLVRPLKAWSNFWGGVNAEGFYSRSFDYMDIVSYERKGVWNVPYINNCYLINASVLPRLVQVYSDVWLDPEMAFCSNLRKMGVFMYVDNLEEMGHLVDNEQFSESNWTSPEMYELITNRLDWEKRYIHPDYYANLALDYKHSQPCPDVYWFPLVTPKFCSDLIAIMEGFGKWSTGSNYDERLTGGYENVPTRDIHMRQVGLEKLWLHFLQQFIRPLQEAVFTGYYHDPPESIMNFVVRYKPDEQPYLRPHHDSSTYTINIALNTPKVDYEGGGCKFLRYNCSVTDTRLGWVLMHPGRLTHYHEGLPVTRGTRYIMISFVNP